MLTHELLARRLRDILDPETDCDAARLEYADLLEETGESERAEFIRVQVELANFCPTAQEWVAPGPGAVLTWQYDALRRRERGLLEAHPAHPRWLGKPDPFPGHPKRHLLAPAATIECLGEGRIECSFHRGFVEAVTLPAADWLAHADALLDAYPVRAVTLTTWPEDARTELAARHGPDRLGWLMGYRREFLTLAAVRWPTVQKWDLPEED